MKTILSLVAVFSAVALNAALTVDGVAARVGAEAILRSDVANELHRMGERDESRYREILDEMIDRKLILRAAASSKMTMQEWLVENRVREIVQKAFDGDRNKLIESLGRQRVSYPEWYRRLKEDMIIGAMRWQIVDKNVTASPSAMSREFMNHPERYNESNKVSFAIIMLNPSEKSRRAGITGSLESRSFESFGAKVYKDVAKPSDLVAEPLALELAKLKKGEVSPWIEVNDWSFLIKKTDETSGRALTFVEAYDAIEANVKEAEARRIYKEWIRRMRAETFIKIY